MDRMVWILVAVGLAVGGTWMGCGSCGKKDGVTTEFCANSKACEAHGKCEARNGRCVNPDDPITRPEPKKAAVPDGPWTVKVRMSRSKPNGDSWDGGLAKWKPPDIYIKVNGTSYESQRCEDSFECSFQIHETGKLNIQVWDRDAGNAMSFGLFKKGEDSAGSTLCSFGERCTTGRGATVYVDK